MNQWSRNRKKIIFAIIVFVLVVLIGAPLFFLFYRAPTCSDKKQNGDETGVDCGGSCQLLCTAESLPLILKGDPRVLAVKDNAFEIVALIENSNTNGEIYMNEDTDPLGIPRVNYYGHSYSDIDLSCCGLCRNVFGNGQDLFYCQR